MSEPSQAVIEAVEQIMCRLVHDGEDWTVPVALPDSSDPRNRVAACYSELTDTDRERVQG